jgi:tetraacyldisaccharide 4'-kinase
MKILLFGYSLLSRTVSAVKSLLYLTHVRKPLKAPLPVISVGNISLGGSGKTPLCMELVMYLRSMGFKPAYISRGYRGNWEKKGGIVSDGIRIQGKCEDAGDEPYMVSKNLPGTGVFVGKNRLLSCQKAKSLGFDIAVLDDGFQHRRLHRDLDIVLFDSRHQPGLREGLSSLKRADILLTAKNSETKSKKNKRALPAIPAYEYEVIMKGLWRMDGEEIRPARDIKKKDILAFCAIAGPARFFDLLEKEDFSVSFLFQFPDHHPYPERTLKKILRKCEEIRPGTVITTEKDAVKIQPNIQMFAHFPLHYLKIGLRIEPDFFEIVCAKINALTS